jgi:hypothetical protein
MCNLNRVVDIRNDSPTVRASEACVGEEVGKEVVNASSLNDCSISGLSTACQYYLTTDTFGIGRPKRANARLTGGIRYGDFNEPGWRYCIDKGLYA